MAHRVILHREGLDFSGSALGFVDPSRKLFEQFGKTFGRRPGGVAMCLEFLPDDLAKLAATVSFVPRSYVL